VLGNYNSLNDPHLSEYFAKSERRRHLIKSGLLTQEGKVIPQRSARLQEIGFERRKHFQTVVDDFISKGLQNREELQKVRENRALEEKMKSDLMKRAKLMYVNRNNNCQIHQKSHRNSCPISVRKPQIRLKAAPNWNYFSTIKVDPKSSKFKSNRPKSSYGRRRSEPALAFTEDETKEPLSDIESLEGESFHEDDDDLRLSFASSNFKARKSQSAFNNKTEQVKITFKFIGITKSSSWPSLIKVRQQAFKCGHSLLIFSKLVCPQETFTVPIRSHVPRLFCITMFVDNLCDFRVNTCCEYKHPPGSRIGHFTIVNIDGVTACESCLNPQRNFRSVAEKFLSRSSSNRSNESSEKNKKEQRNDKSPSSSSSHSEDENHDEVRAIGCINDTLPCVVKRGSNARLEVDFIAPFNARFVRADVRGKVDGSLAPVYIPWTGVHRNACDGHGIQCPVVRNTGYRYHYDLKVDQNIPTFKVDYVWKLTNIWGINKLILFGKEVRSDVVDKILVKLREEVTEPFNLNSSSLPDTELQISPQFVIKLTNGKVDGFLNVKRIGDGYIHREESLITVNAFFGFPNLSFSYRAITRFLLFNRWSELKGKIGLVTVDLLFDIISKGENIGKVGKVIKFSHRSIKDLEIDRFFLNPVRIFIPNDMIVDEINNVIQKKLDEFKEILKNIKFTL
ncbi:hypothetical protein B4U79_08585, partial [Dinothrombium tinctorium]